SNQYGEQNKLGNSQFIRVNILQAGAYTFNIVKSGGSLTSSNPEFILFHKGALVNHTLNQVSDSVSGTVNLVAGNYLLEVYDRNHRDGQAADIKNTSCFEVRAN
ncbi:MAG: hypothetical protein ABW044_12775, partial [Cellvibrio sp.]